MKNKEVRYGEALFDGIETIRTSRFSHYLVSNSDFLEINAMKAIYLGMREINDLLDELSWGILYPIYKFYKRCRGTYRKYKNNRAYQEFNPSGSRGREVPFREVGDESYPLQ